jgi:hypothetical protein
MNKTSRPAVAVGALVLSVGPLLLAVPAAADTAVGTTASIEYAERQAIGGSRPTKAQIEQAERDAVAGDRASRQQEQQAYLDRLDAAARGARSTGPATTQLAPASTGDDGVPVSVVTVLTIGGLAVGAGAALGLRRVQIPRRRQLAVH